MRRMIVLVGTIALVSTSASVVSASSDPLIVGSDTTLTADHDGSIVVVADGVTLDCAGSTVSGDPTRDGILIDGHDGVTIRNCVVTNALDGIRAVGVAGIRLEGNTVVGSAGYGIRLTGASESTVGYNAALGNRLSGILLEGAVDSLLVGNEANGNGTAGFPGDSFGDGVTMLGSRRNVVVGNEAVGNAWAGFYLQDSERNLLEDNQARGNGFDNLISGFDLQHSSRNVLRANVSIGNGSSGFYTYQSRSNVLRSNVATSNAHNGFGLDEGTTKSVFERNTATENLQDGFLLAPAATQNRLSGNEVISNEGNGLHLSASDENILRVSSATGNIGSGILVEGAGSDAAEGNLIMMNDATSNGAWGIALLFGADLNIVARNTACDNAIADAIDDGTGNLMRGNVFCIGP